MCVLEPRPDYPDDQRVFPTDSDAAFNINRLARWMQGQGIEEMTVGVTEDGRPYIAIRTSRFPDAQYAQCRVGSMLRRPLP